MAFAPTSGMSASGIPAGRAADDHRVRHGIADFPAVRPQLLASRYGVPTVYTFGAAARAGGLMSYGGDTLDAYHLLGVYVGRILNGDRPADLPVHQSAKVHLVFNLKAAKALNINVPANLLARADEVIE